MWKEEKHWFEVLHGTKIIMETIVVKDIAENLDKLQLDTIDKRWVQAVWESQFTEVTSIPGEYDENVLQTVDVVKIFTKTASVASNWIKTFVDDQHHDQAAPVNDSIISSLSGAPREGNLFWTVMREHGIRIKDLIALLFYFLDKGLQFNATSKERNESFSSSSLYFILLGLPGSGAFEIFHPVLFNKALDTFKLTTKLQLARFSPNKKKKGRGKAFQKTAGFSQDHKPRRRHASRANSNNSFNFNEDEWNDSDDDLDSGLLNPEEIKQLTTSLNNVLFNFLILLDHGSLKRSSECLEAAIQELVELTHLETSYANLDFGHFQRRSDVSALAFNAYIGLFKLCNPVHGKIEKTIVLILKYLLPGVLMNFRGSSELSSRGLAVVREHTLHFVKYIINQMGSQTYKGIEILIQHIALQVPERAEYRHKASQAIVILMREVPGPMFKKVVHWLFCWAHNEKVAHRLFSVEVMGRLLQEEERDEKVEIPEEDEDLIAIEDDNLETASKKTLSQQSDLVSHKFIFGVIFSRCRDVAPTVRAKALQTLAEITASNNPTMTMVISNLFSRPSDVLSTGNDKETQPDSEFVDFVELLEKGDDLDLASVDPLPSSKAFIDFIRKRSLDDSVYVRKNALQVLENILIHFSAEVMTKDLISILANHCRDSSLMIRKQMVSAMTTLLKKYVDNDLVIQYWVEGVFPLILDVEQKCAEKAQEAVWECLFGNLVKYEEAVKNAHFLPWKILSQAQKELMTKYLSRACGEWAKEGLLKASILNVLKTHVNTENNEHAWLLLSLVTHHVPLKDPHFVMDYFKTSIHAPEGVSLFTLLQVLRVLYASVIRLTKEEQKFLQKDLITLLQRFLLHPELISTAVDIATVVSRIEAGEGNLKKYQSNIDDWVVGIIKQIDEELSSSILNPQSVQAETIRMMRQIFTLGELAQICPLKINNRLFLLMQSIIFQQGKHKKNKKPEEETLVPSSQTQSSQPPPCGFTPTTKLQALSVVTLAKMCLQHEDMAKKIVPAFGRLLDTSTDIAIKNNVMYALTDMCVRYANLVDPLIPQITACLKDKSLVVRRTTLITLIHLLQEDYLKMSGRGAFFFRILQTLNDQSKEMRHLTTFYIQQRLLKRKPKIMYQNFIEAIFHFNEYVGHQKFNKFIISDRERQLFSLKGSKNKERRMKLFKFMLESMNDEERFQTTFRICHDVLNGVVEDQIPISQNSLGLLQDALACLSCEEIKLASLKAKQDDEENQIPEEDMRGAIMHEAKKTIISQVVKKNMIENIIPIVIALKHKLEKIKSPLIDDLMSCLREIMKDYKNEVKDMLAADKQLASEIEFDLKKWEEEQKKLEEIRKENQGLQSNEALRNQEAIRALLESAASAIRKRMASRHHGSEEALVANEGDQVPEVGKNLQVFLESNNVLNKDRIPASVSKKLCPNVVVTSIPHNLLTEAEKKDARRNLQEQLEKADLASELSIVLIENDSPSDSSKENQKKINSLNVGETEVEISQLTSSQNQCSKNDDIQPANDNKRVGEESDGQKEEQRKSNNETNVETNLVEELCAGDKRIADDGKNSNNEKKNRNRHRKGLNSEDKFNEQSGVPKIPVINNCGTEQGTEIESDHGNDIETDSQNIAETPNKVEESYQNKEICQPNPDSQKIIEVPEMGNTNSNNLPPESAHSDRDEDDINDEVEMEKGIRERQKSIQTKEKSAPKENKKENPKRLRKSESSKSELSPPMGSESKRGKSKSFKNKASPLATDKENLQGDDNDDVSDESVSTTSPPTKKSRKTSEKNVKSNVSTKKGNDEKKSKSTDKKTRQSNSNSKKGLSPVKEKDEDNIGSQSCEQNQTTDSSSELTSFVRRSSRTPKETEKMKSLRETSKRRDPLNVSLVSVASSTASKMSTSTKILPRGVARLHSSNKNVCRAISTPNKHDTFYTGGNVTLEQSHELSAIPVVSPPTTRKRKRIEVQCGVQETDESNVSFRFRRGKKDLFEDLVSRPEPRKATSSSRISRQRRKNDK